ncbi:hypothetical protein Pcac1_g9676 [Phytophthora cactorum]|nr:hypothetical protein Pcac1_g9676 [Phytophthora cactorum]
MVLNEPKPASQHIRALSASDQVRARNTQAFEAGSCSLVLVILDFTSSKIYYLPADRHLAQAMPSVMAPSPCYVLLMPEDTPDPLVLTPAYGKVTSVSREVATTNLLSPPNSAVEVLAAVMTSRQVDASEYHSGAPGEWLRQAAMATIRTLRGKFHSRVSDLVEVEVEPVMCFLTGNFHQRVSNITMEELAEQHTEIRDRILGRGRRASRSVARLLNGLIPTCVHPKPEDTLDWIQGPSGMMKRVSYASVPDEPASTDASPTGDEDGNGNADGNDHSDLAALLNSIGRTENPSPPTSPRQEHSAQDSPAIDHDSHAKILAAIANEPSLVRFYLQLSQPQATKRLANGQSKHAFARSRTQRLIHSTISAPEYTGKLPSAVVDAMISSRSTKFKPHPAIIARVFDIQFGARGLSVMHLTRFDFAAR